MTWTLISFKTSRELSKSAPYLRLKNSKRTSKYSLLRYRKTQKLNRIGTPEATLLNFSSILSQIIKKIGGAPLVKFFLKKSHNAEKTERGDPLGFSTSVLSENSKKIEGGSFGNFFSKKSLTEPKIL